MENKYFIDDLAYDEAECEEKYDHKYLGQEGLRELIGIVKFQLRELNDLAENHDLRLQDLENAVQIIEDRLDANDKRLDEFAIDMESSEPLTIEQAVDAILQYAREIDSVEFGSEVLSVQEAFDLVEDQIEDLGAELDDVVEELKDGVVNSIEYNGESFKPEDIYDKPQPEDLSVEYDESDEGYVRADETHYVIKAVSNGFTFTKELEKGVIEYNFGAKCLDEHNFVNKEGYGFKLTLGDAIIDSTTGAVNATEVGELDDHNFFESDTLRSIGTIEVERADEPIILTLTWLLQTPPLDDPNEELKIEYTFLVPALGDDVYRENVVVIPTDIDLSNATVLVGEGSEEERKTIKEAIDDLHKEVEDEAEAREAADQNLQEALDEEKADREHEDELLWDAVENLDSRAVEAVEYKGEVIWPEQRSEGNIVDLNVISDDIHELLEEIGKIIQISYDVVEELPEVGELGVIYLVPIESSESDNIYEEYLFIGEGSEGHFELIGTTKVDLSEVDELKDRLDHFNGTQQSLEWHANQTAETLSNLADWYQDLLGRLNQFNYGGEYDNYRIEDVIASLEALINNQGIAIQNLDDEVSALSDDVSDHESRLSAVEDEIITNVQVNSNFLPKNGGTVNIPLVSDSVDGVLPKFTNADGYLQDGDIVLVMRNGVPTWTEVDIYSLNP